MHHRSAHARFRLLRWAALLLIAPLVADLLTLPISAQAQSDTAEPPPSERIGDRAVWAFEGNAIPDADAFVAAWDGPLTQSITEIELVLDLVLPVAVPVRVVADQAMFSAAAAPEIGESAPIRSTLAMDGLVIEAAAWQALSLTAAEHAMRHAVAHLAIAQATGGLAPAGFAEGLARYLEQPANERIARDTAVLQAAYQRGALPSWFDLNRYLSSLDQELLSAQSYAVAAFLIERYDLGPLRQVLGELAAGSSWTIALRAAYGRDPNALERQWRDDLPRWLSLGWRTNIMAAFNLEPANQYLAKGDYAAAKRALEPSQALVRQIRAPAFAAEVEQLASECDTGIQAESLMTQTHAALLERDYERADMLLVQAETLYNALPVEQQPRSLIEQWGQIARDGMTAGERLADAQRLARRWADARAAQTAAAEAGTLYARIGDSEGAAAAQAILDRLGERQIRYAIVLIALALLVVIWLALWTWTRGPSELRWPRLREALRS